MLRLELSVSDIVGAVMLRLEYFSGKRASSADGFYRFSPCEADMPLLHELCRDSLVAVADALGSVCAGFSFRADGILISLRVSSAVEGNETYHELLEERLRTALTAHILFRWLVLAGSPEAASFASEAAAGLDLLAALLRAPSPLRPRRTSPL